MDHHAPEQEKRIERSAMSVDQILDEYWARVAEETRRSQEARRQRLTDDRAELPVADAEPDDTDEDGVRIYRPGSHPAPRSWQNEEDFPEVYDQHHAPEEDLLQGPHEGDAPKAEDDTDEDDEGWYEFEDEEVPPRPMSARDILREYWTANAHSYRVELPEEREAPKQEAEAQAEDAVAIYTPMSVRDILKEYWADNAQRHPVLPTEKPEIEEAEARAAAKPLPEPEAAPPEAEAAPASAREDTYGDAARAEDANSFELQDILREYWLLAEDRAQTPEPQEKLGTSEEEPDIRSEEEPDIWSEEEPAHLPETEAEGEPPPSRREMDEEEAQAPAPPPETQIEADAEEEARQEAVHTLAPVYAREVEPSVQDILKEYWTSGESEPIQDAQLRAELDAERDAQEEADTISPIEAHEKTTYRPSQGLSSDTPEDAQHGAEDLGLTVENILAEYWAARKAAAAAAAQPKPKPEPEPEIDWFPDRHAEEAHKEPPQGETAEESAPAVPEDLAAMFGLGAAAAGAAAGVAAETAAQAASAPAKAGGALSAMAEEARRFIAQMEGSGYAGLGEEADYTRRGRERRRIDPRFNLGGQRQSSQRMTFDGKEVDLSADENYVPPSAVGVDLPAGWEDEDEVEYPERPEPRWLSALRGWGTQKAPKKRALNAPRTDYDPYGFEAMEQDARHEAADEDAAVTLREGEDLSPEAMAALLADREERPPQPAYDMEELESAADFFRSPEARKARARLRRTGHHAAPEPEDGDLLLEDLDAAPASYAADEDYGERYEDAREDPYAAARLPEPDLEDDSFPSFGQWLMSLLTDSLIRIRGVGDEDNADTMEDDVEELGAELAPAAASKYYGGHLRTLRLRFRIGLGLLVVMAWLTLGLPVSGALKSGAVTAAMLLGMQLTIMLLCLDVVTNAAINLTRARFGADNLACLACVLTSIDALSMAIGGFGSSHTPLCLLSSLSLMGVLLSSLLSARGLRKAMRVPAIARRCYAVTAERGVKGKKITLLKSVRSASGFVRRAEEAPPDETLFVKLSPFLLLAALLMTAVVCVVKKCGADFLYVLTAILCPGLPVTALLCFALPYCMGSLRIFPSGAAVAGWSGVNDIGRSANLIVTDRDLFPEGSVEIESVRIFADAPSEKILSYAGTMVTAAGSGVSHCFAELMERNGGVMRQVEHFEHLAGGGMKGIINGETVLCGNTDLMRLMNVRIPYRLVSRTSVLLAIDGVLYGIFNMSYTPLPQVKEALVGLIRSNRHPVFAIRDFNISPETLHSIFDVATDGYDFPPYIERFAISEAKPAKESKLAAVVCREGLGPLVHMADTGRSIYVATRINLLMAVLSGAISMLAVFLTLLGAGYVSPLFLTALMLVWCLPMAVISLVMRF